ncbi:DUF5675 family protein [Namhaeicola litoreus]|uniref:DUF5675 family protein n=1 Tax=Namhaeicola litoreus TaxID=1052145 RepID=A0ABW3Y430_9FLAO
MFLELFRVYDEKGVNGTLFLNGKMLCHTIELPWKQNQVGISCIPEGTYDLSIRYTKKFGFHLRILNVFGRTNILIHPANNALKELKGCIAPVSILKAPGEGLFSIKATSILMHHIKYIKRANEQLKLIIKSSNHEYPRKN